MQFDSAHILTIVAGSVIGWLAKGFIGYGDWRAKDSNIDNRLKSIEEQIKSMADHNIRLTVVETTLPQIRDELREIKDLLRSHSN